MLNTFIISIIIAVVVFMSDISTWNGVGESGDKNIVGTSISAGSKLSEYGQTIDAYNQVGGYKATMRFTDEGSGSLVFYDGAPESAVLTIVPADGADFANALVSGTDTVPNMPFSEYSISPTDFDDGRSTNATTWQPRKKSLIVQTPNKLQFSGFAKGDTVFVSFGSYVRYRVSGTFQNAHDDALSDGSVIDSNGFLNAITDQSNVNGQFSK